MGKEASGRNWPAAKIELWPVDRIRADKRNARRHPDGQIDAIRSSIREFGVTFPALVREDGTLIAGEGRWTAAKLEGLVEFPVVVARGWTEAQCRAYSIADNRLTDLSEFDAASLRLELTELQGEGINLALTGFSGRALKEALALPQGGKTDPDDVPEPPANTISKRGDVWLLGEHRLLCGDSTDAADVARVLQGGVPHLMVTDPPYGVEYDADWRNKMLRSDGTPITGRAIGKVENDGRADWREAWALFPGNVAYVWHAGSRASEVQSSLEAARFNIRSQIIWAKNTFVIGRGNYHWQHEPCWYAVRNGATSHWNGDRKQTTLWEIPKPQKSETGHSTQKPVECMKRPIEKNSRPGDAVYEPFSGSGTTIIAAEMTGRSCLAIELNPAYVDVAVKRWEDYTGKKAKCETAK
jgi:DNA modification methylase